MYNSMVCSKVFTEVSTILNDGFIKAECNVFSRLYKMYCNRAERRLEVYYSDIWSAQKLGFMPESEASETINKLQTLVRDLKCQFSETYENMIGETEYEIQWVLDGYCKTREEAIKQIAEWNEL